MDLGMPNVDGWEAARMMHTRGVNAVIIALGEWGWAEDQQRTEEAGFDHIS
jgi:CheY-like chemotaxis protein